MVMGYYDLILQAIYFQIELQKWSIGSFHSKAKSTISTGAVVLSITTAAMTGFAALHSRADRDALSVLEPIFGSLAVPAICLGVAGIAAIIVSMIISIHALKGRPISQILSSSEFALAPKGGSADFPKGAGMMSGDELGHRLQLNAIGTIRTLEDYSEWIAPRVHAGQALLLVGIGLMSTVPAVALLWALLSSAPA